MERLSDNEMIDKWIDEWNNNTIQENAPVNNIGGGMIAGVGIGQQGEPGVYMRKKNRIMLFSLHARRKLSP